MLDRSPLVLVAWLAATCAACSYGPVNGQGAAAAPPVDGGGDGGAFASSGGTSSGGTSNGGSSSGGSPSGGTSSGGASSGGTSSGGASSGGTPTSFLCAGATTCLPGQVCCLPQPSGAAYCAAGGCATGDIPMQCNGASDCPSGDKCCADGSGSTFCATSCGGDEYQACTTSSECAGTFNCQPETCYGYPTMRCASAAVGCTP